MVRIIGLISGTSVDGIDAALVDIVGHQRDLEVKFLAGATYPYSPELRDRILAVCQGHPLSMAELAELDDAIATAFAQAALSLQKESQTVQLIGSHGQTVYHRPAFYKQDNRQQDNRQDACSTIDQLSTNRQDAYDQPSTVNRQPSTNKQYACSTGNGTLGYSLQLGRGDLIARLTQIPTVSNFRAADIAVGGEGAPLVPAVDAYLLRHSSYNRCVQNLGGIGNLTYLPKAGNLGEAEAEFSNENSQQPPILGWDTGPGNTLLDLATQYFSDGQQSYDHDGAWAAQGTPCHPLVEQWLQHEFFHQSPPKSTGRELFGWDYLQQCLEEAKPYHLSPADFLATLTELTAQSIYHSYKTFLPQFPDQILLCGGGSHNLYLKQRLQMLFHPIPILTTTEMGLNADFKEAIAFAVLAYWRFLSIPGNLPAVTGAESAVLLGDIYPPGFLNMIG